MALSTLKKRKVDLENRQFKKEWTEKYVHVETPDGKPMCLLCNTVSAVAKEYNVRRHFATHDTFDDQNPPGSDIRKEKIQKLSENYDNARKKITNACTAQQKATAAYLRVAWILGKNKKPFTESEMIKKCILAAVEEVVTEDKVREQVMSCIKSIPMSDTTTGRRMDILATNVFDTLLDQLRKADFMSLAVDESTDNSDIAQLCLYVRFFDGNVFREDLLGLIALKGQTTGEIIFQKIVDFFKDNELNLENVNMLVTDGAPSMSGRVKGLSARLAVLAPKMKSLHCLIHQSVLCARLSGELKDTMDSVMALINFIRATSSLQHRLFRQLLADMSADHSDLLLHNDVRWLSKGNALKRVCDLREEIISFLSDSKQKKAGALLLQMQDVDFVSQMCFLSDIFHHLNTLNVELQGRNKTVVDVVESLTAFQRKLVLFSSDLTTKMLQFPTLRDFIKSSTNAKVTAVMTDFIDKLRHNFAARFDDFKMPKELLHFVSNPFVSADISSKGEEFLASLDIDEGSLQLEIIDLQESSALKQAYDTEGFIKLWTKFIHVNKFPNTKKLALFVLTMFGSTYTCESSFSHMNAIKTSSRASLTNEHLHHCLRVALTSYEPSFSSIAQSKKCHFSH